ncbi:MAG: hypothetical protein QM586_16490 [Xenophilus sp.]
MLQDFIDRRIDLETLDDAPDPHGIVRRARGPLHALPDGRLLARDSEAGGHWVEGLPQAIHLTPAWSDFDRGGWALQAATVRPAARSGRLLACCTRRRRDDLQRELPPERRWQVGPPGAGSLQDWTVLAPPQPAEAGAPAGLACWVEEDIVLLQPRPSPAKRLPASLRATRFSAQGALLDDRDVLPAGAPRKPPMHERAWMRPAGPDRTIARLWGCYWLVDRDGVRTLAPPAGLASGDPGPPSAERDGRLWWVRCTPDGHQAWLDELDLVRWRIGARVELTPLLRHSRTQGIPWMPAHGRALALDDDWLVLDLHDGSPLQSTFLWLYSRQAQCAWSVTDSRLRDLPDSKLMTLPGTDRLLLSGHGHLWISHPLSALAAGLRAQPARGRALALGE